MGTIASQITSLTIVYSIVYSDADQRKHQSSASLAFVRWIHRGPVNSPHKWPVTRKNVSIWWRHHERYKRRGALTVRVLHNERRSEPIGRWWGRRHRNVGRPSVKRLARARHRPKNGVKYDVSDGIRDMIVTSETWKCTPTSQIAKRLLQHGKTVRNST